MTTQKKEKVFNGHFDVTKYTITENDSTYERDICVSKDAVFVLPFDPIAKKVVIINEKRFGILPHVSHSIEHIETWSSIAGTVDKILPLEEIVSLELKEEAGIDMDDGELTKLVSHYSSPGIMSEKKHLYIFEFDSSNFIEGVFGAAEENEVTHAKLVSYSDAVKMIDDGDIMDLNLMFALLKIITM